MQLLKKIILGIAAFVLILWGGAGTQSNSLLLQGGGFVILIAGLIILYIFLKMAWRAMGCLPSFIVFAGIMSFIVYAIGGFNNGIHNVGRNIQNFFGQSPVVSGSSGNKIMLMDETSSENPENFADTPSENSSGEGPIRRLVNSFTKTDSASFNPESFPVVYGKAKVVNANTLILNGRYFRLYGLDAPELSQMCANRQGRSYQCGREAANWLRSWIDGYALECRVMQQDEQGNMAGICSLGQYDIGAALVKAGWAVAYTKYSDVYVPYQQEAMHTGSGLWQGQFYMPWDWREQQRQVPKIKVIKPKKTHKKGLLDV